MSVRGLTCLLAAGAATLVVTGAAAAPPPPVPGETAALAAVKRAVKSGWLDRASAAADRAEIARAVHLARVLPHARRAHVEVALEQVGALAGRLTKPRALAVFGQLRANDDYFAQHAAPRNKTDITGTDGIVYRYFTGRCFEFHPLANFGALNAHVTAKDTAATQQLADALVARGVHSHGSGIRWEYYFRFAGGQPPWTSGMAQAVAAQAFARAAALVTSESTVLLHQAAGAFRAIPGRLMTKVAAGPWIRLYSFKPIPVLNAQLQSVLSLESYAKDTGDSTAAALATQMEQAAAATLPNFDTGFWTDYSLDGGPSPLSYEKYVVGLLRSLAPDDPRFADAAGRFATYLRQPPAFKVTTAPLGMLRFWLSKPASVSIVTAATSTKHLSLRDGWHTIRWAEPKRAGIYKIRVTAVGPAGNQASFTALPLVRVTTGQHRPAAGPGRRRPLGSSTPAVTPSAFAVGAGIDAAAQTAQATSLGLQLVRMTIPWQPNETAPDPGVLASLQSLSSATGLVLELSVSELPADDTGRAALAQYAASLASQAPSLRDLVLTPAPSLSTAPAYADVLAAVRTAVGAVRSDVAVGPSVDGSVSQPRRTVLALGEQLAQDGAPPEVVAFQPASGAGFGQWKAADVDRLESALAASLGDAPPVLLDALAAPTTVPASELGAYAGGPPPTDGAFSPAAQASLYAAAIGAASCSPNVTGLLLDRLVDDGTAPEPATGLYYASGDAKPSAAAVAHAIAAVARGAVVCPGTGARITPTTLTFPEQLAATSPVSVVLGCSRDCLYLITLDRPHGHPVLARRGTLQGGGAAQTITLPQRTLPAGQYRLDVRLVSRVNPGPLTRQLSPFFTVG